MWTNLKFSLEVYIHKMHKTTTKFRLNSVVLSSAATPPAGHLVQHPFSSFFFVPHYYRPHSINFGLNFFWASGLIKKKKKKKTHDCIIVPLPEHPPVIPPQLDRHPGIVCAIYNNNNNNTKKTIVHLYVQYVHNGISSDFCFLFRVNSVRSWKGW